MQRKILKSIIGLGLLTVVILAFNFTREEKIVLVDKNASTKTVSLINQLKTISKNHVIFGHQDDLAYGVHWWAENGKSDVHDVVGDYPALYGWDVGNIESERNLDDVLFDSMRMNIIESHNRGGIHSISWHMRNLKNNTHSWDTDKVVNDMLPEGELHSIYKDRLDLFANFLNTLKDDQGKLIPILFRPFHEFTGSWFWWGRKHCTSEEYIALWQFTVKYLRDVKGLHNLIYVYSSDRFENTEDYLERYPGDDYVDVLGVDDYYDFKPEGPKNGTDLVIKNLQTIVSLAEEKGKIAAFTETGLEAVKDPQWFTEKLLKVLLHDEQTKKIAYIMVWRNANDERSTKNHFYAPYPGHSSEQDFKDFYNHPFTLFESDLDSLTKVNNQ